MQSDFSFVTEIEGAEKGRAYVVLPFNPEDVWGARPKYHIRGAVDRHPVRGALDTFARGYFLPLGPAWRRGAGLCVGDRVSVTLSLEGPQSVAAAPDIATALEAEPAAAAFFDGLATFYRKNYLRWIDATKRSPDVRAQRIAELVQLMKAGVKERPR